VLHFKVVISDKIAHPVLQKMSLELSKKALFCPLLCGGQVPCGRFCQPFFYGSRAPSAGDAFWAGMFFSSETLQSVLVSAISDMINTPFGKSVEKADITLFQSPCDFLLYITAGNNVNLFFK